MQNAMSGLTEKDMLQDMLTLEKDIVKTYGSFIVEVTCENLRGVINGNIKETADGQFQIFNSMKTRNYYPVKEAQSAEVEQAKTKFSGVMSKMS